MKTKDCDAPGAKPLPSSRLKHCAFPPFPAPPRPAAIVSDQRKKNDISDLQLGVDFIKKFKPKSYRMKNSENKISFGLLAQDILENMQDSGLDIKDYNLISEYSVGGKESCN